LNLIHFCLKRLVSASVSVFRTRFVHWTTPLTSSLPFGTLTDLARSKAERVRGKCALTTTTHHPQEAGETPIMQEYGSHPPRALSTGCSGMEANAHDSFNQIRGSRWHREHVRLYWKRRSKATSHEPTVAAETIAFIREMATENRLWGAERIRGELLKLGISVCKRTIQKYIRNVRSPQPRGQKWATFVHNHAAQIWACDALSGHGSLLSTALCVLHHRIARHGR
jgi:putative transposase